MIADAQFWDDIAQKYSRKPLPNPDSTRRKLDVVRSLMAPRDTVLDIGCGTGTIALELATHAAFVHGVDISREMLKIARDKAQAQKVENVDFRQAGVDEAFEPFAARSLAGVCAFNILHLVEDWKGVVQRTFDVLEPGGYFVSSTGCLGGSLVPYRPFLTVLRWLGKAPPVEMIHKRELIQAIREAGFQDIAEPDVGAGKATAFIVARRSA